MNASNVKEIIRVVLQEVNEKIDIKGQCKILSEGSACTCVKHQIDRMEPEDFLKALGYEGGEVNSKDFDFLRENKMADEEWLRNVLSDASNIKIHVTWNFDERQADPFHQNFTSDEFVRRLKRFLSSFARGA